MTQRTVVWITGASRGIGRALAQAVPWADADVLDVSRSGGSGHPHVEADLATVGGWDALGESFTEQLTGLSAGDRAVLVHNAGTLEPIGFAGEVDTAAYDGNVLLNAAAPQAIGHRFLAAVAGRDLEAHLVVLTSGAASSPYPGWSAYGAGKAAVDQWVRTVGKEQQERGGVQVLAIAPGVVDTDMQRHIRSVDPHDFPNQPRFVELHRQGELRDPGEVAQQLWAAVTSGEHASGSVLDLRAL